MNLTILQEKKCVVLGYGVNNRHLCGYLLRHGIHLVIRDKNEAHAREFSKQHPEWKDLVEWQVMPDITQKLEGFEIIFRTPGIPLSTPGLKKAKAKGAEISSQTKLFFDLCPAPIIGITGTNGKGTTASLIFAILKEGYKKGKVYLGGNIGVDPFSFLDTITTEDLVVLEMSSFQLQDLHKSPHIAVVLHVTVDHLDHHATVEEYRTAKAQILAHQGEQDIAIVNMEYPEMHTFAQKARGLRYGYSRHTPARQSAWAEYLEGKEVVFYQMDTAIESFEITGRKLIGEHNLENILPAVLVGSHYHVPGTVMQKIIREFPGLEHRLSFVGKAQGVDFYDDSIATTPASCQAALRAFPKRRIHLIAGGSDKGNEYGDIAEEMILRCTSISLLPGEATKKLQSALTQALKKHPNSNCRILDKAKDPLMEDILSRIAPYQQPGDVVLLAPAAASFASFANYKERGDAFKAAVYKRYAN